MKKIAKGLSLLLCVAMLFTLMACSQTSQTQEAATEPAQEQTETAAATEEPAAEEATEEATEPEYVFKYAHTGPATGVQQDGALALGEYLEEYSNGRIVQETYPAGQLAEKQASLEGLKLGTIELCELAATDFAQFDDIWDVFALPYLFDSGLQAVQVMQDPDVRAITDQSAADMGYVILSWWNFGERNVINTKHAINTPDDLKGIKIRVMQSASLVKAMEALGASPVSMAWTECYTAMQQGTIDAVENSTPIITSNGFNELAKYYAFTKHFIVSDPVFMSKVVYDALPADLQEAVIQAGKAAEANWNDTLWPAAEEKELNTMKESGVEITYPVISLFQEKAAVATEEAVAEFNARQLELYNTILSVKDKYQ